MQKRIELLAQYEAAPDNAFFSIMTLMALCQIAKSTVWKWIVEGRLPPPQKLSAQCSRWRKADIQKALEKLGGTHE